MISVAAESRLFVLVQMRASRNQRQTAYSQTTTLPTDEKDDSLKRDIKLFFEHHSGKYFPRE